ncbi:MAG: DegT/DnrJ/EryC1/StrS family aminotransferase [Burkholderiales bacterium]|nr:DegT/DnrJ/EryC1/StrS family aminotransferase [Burkholderiales bacterium]
MATLRSGWLGTGPRVASFEAQFARYKGLGPDHAAAVNSGTAALHLSLVAAGVGPGDEVITTPLTFCATANAILHTGAIPVLADVDPASMNIDAGNIAARVTARTKAVLPVHFAGRPCDMDAVMAVADEHGLAVIEDCAHAVEARWREKPVGTLGDYGCFSFYASKNLTTGEGGMVLGRDAQKLSRIRSLSLHGMTRDAWQRYSSHGFVHYDVVECGFKYNMMDLQAAIGLHQLKRVERAWEARKAIWNTYQQAFRGLPVTLPAEVSPHARHAFHLYTLLVDEAACGVARDRFLERMTSQGVGVGVHYTALPQHTYYRERLGWKPQDTPVATAIGRTTVSLPLAPQLSSEAVARVITAVRGALA